MSGFELGQTRPAVVGWGVACEASRTANAAFGARETLAALAALAACRSLAAIVAHS